MDLALNNLHKTKTTNQPNQSCTHVQDWLGWLVVLTLGQLLVGCFDTRSIIKRSLTGLNTEFSFSLIRCNTKVKSALKIYHNWRENSWIHAFSKCISTTWNSNRLLMDLNWGCRFHFLRWYQLHDGRLPKVCVHVCVCMWVKCIYKHIYARVCVYVCVYVCVRALLRRFRFLCSKTKHTSKAIFDEQYWLVVGWLVGWLDLWH